MSEKLQTIKNSTIKKGSVSTQVILILISCLAAAFLQGCGFLSLSHYDQILILTCIFLAYFALLYYLIRRCVNRTARNKNLPEDTLQYVHAYAVDEESHELLVKEEDPEPPKKEKEPKKTSDSKTEEEK